MRGIEGGISRGNKEQTGEMVDGKAQGHRQEMNASDWPAARGLEWNILQLSILDMLEANKEGVPIAAFKRITASISTQIGTMNLRLLSSSLPYEIRPTKIFRERTSPIEYKMYRIGRADAKDLSN